MWTPLIAEELQRRGYDVEAVAAREDLRSRSDVLVFLAAQREQRAVVTENVRHFVPLARDVIRRGGNHWGLVLTPASFRRGQSLGRLMKALEALIAEAPDQRNLERWLR
jgi:hypothetical protein